MNVIEKQLVQSFKVCVSLHMLIKELTGKGRLYMQLGFILDEEYIN